MTAKKHTLSTAKVIKNAEVIFNRVRWGYGIVVCPYCGSLHIAEYDGYRYKCNSCKRRFTDKTNTLMHGSKLPVSVWMQAIYEMSVDNFISSVVMSKKLGINQKSAWLLMTKLRFAMPQDKVILEGIIAQDEMYVGGCLSNFHYSRKLDLLRKNHFIKQDDYKYTKEKIFALNKALKQPVFGMTNGDKVVLYATPNPIKKEYIRKLYRKHAKRGSSVVSDESALYIDWEQATGSKLYTNNHHNNQYQTKEGLTSNAIENRFSWFKRGFNGKITHCKYHQLYLNEYAFRFNTKSLSTEDKFNQIISNSIGIHYTYNDIRNYNFQAMFISKKKLQEKEAKEKAHMEALKKGMEIFGITEIRNKGKVYTLSDFE